MGGRQKDMSLTKIRYKAANFLREIYPPGLTAFIANSIIEENNAFQWRFNLRRIQRDFKDIICDTPFIPLIHQFRKPFLMLKGENSDFVTAEQFDMIKTYFPNAKIEEISQSNHYISTKAPKKMSEKIKNFIDQN